MSQNVNLYNYIKETLHGSHAGHNNPEEFTAGIEHEFFLLTKNDCPSNNEQSQAFLKLLAKQPGWHIHQTEVFNGIKYIWRVSRDLGDNRFCAVKYDHHPHQIEIAFPYYNNLYLLKDDVQQTLKLFSEIAHSLDLKIGTSANLPIPATDPRVMSELQDFKNLRYYRSKLYELRGNVINHEAANYAAVISATQTHIGGLKWWENNSYLSTLYKLEPELLEITTPSHSKESLLKQRWQGYKSVFEGYPLVGFPMINDWSLNEWVNALIHSPLAAGSDCSWAGKRLVDLDTSVKFTWPEFFKKVRDLQIIRPRLIGTLEFRSDPSQPTSERIIAVAALRLGLTLATLIEPSIVTTTFENSRTRWWEMVEGRQPLQTKKRNVCLDFVRNALKTRKLGEEDLLNCLGNYF